MSNVFIIDGECKDSINALLILCKFADFSDSFAILKKNYWQK